MQNVNNLSNVPGTHEICNVCQTTAWSKPFYSFQNFLVNESKLLYYATLKWSGSAMYLKIYCWFISNKFIFKIKSVWTHNDEENFEPAINNQCRKYRFFKSLPNLFQVLLKWGVQRGYTVLPKSTNPEHIKQNFNLDFILSDGDMETLNNLHKVECVKYAWDPVNVL